ncbi:MAG: aldo/keto reductase [Kiritimatiellaeota bacterium]|nr:aldo/keto reductase [Kiritimatiellota bacterium]
MKHKTLGTTGLQVSVVGLGTWAIGGGAWWGATDDQVSIRAIRAALDSGINLIDTAPVYGFGRSEEVVGKAIKANRDKVILATKCGLWWEDNRGAPFFEIDGRMVRRSLRPATIIQEVENSLRRLGTDRIDLLQTHWQAVEPEPTPIAETMACLLELKAQGKIRAIGVSNVTCAQMDEYRSAGVIDSCQPRYSMLDRAIEHALLPYCVKHGIATLVYSPLEQGLLSGTIGMDRHFSEQEHRNSIPWFKPEHRRKVLDLLAGWRDLTEKHHCTLSQLVIAWTVAQPGVTVALCGARKAEHAVENARAGFLTLEAAELARMRKEVEALGTAK